MNSQTAETLEALHSELDNLRRYIAIREKGDARPYMHLGNIAFIPIKQPTHKTPLVVHLGCGIFIEKSDAEVKAKMENILGSIKKQEERIYKNLCHNSQKAEMQNHTCNSTSHIFKPKARLTTFSVRYELPPFIFDNDPRIAVIEHTAAVKRQSESRKICSKFAIERL